MTISKPTETAPSGGEQPGELEEEIRVNMISLGCPKNLVDSEMILGKLGQEGFVLTPESEDADVIVVNACGVRRIVELTHGLGITNTTQCQLQLPLIVKQVKYAASTTS